MYKATLDLGRVNKYLKLKFSLVIKGEKYLPLLNKFEMNGNDYLKISPIPMVTLEIKSNADRKEEWNPNRSLCFSKVTMFLFCKRLKEIIHSFKAIKELFYYEGDRLTVDKNLAHKVVEQAKVGSKTCMFLPIVIEDEDTHDLFEGVVLLINSADNYCMMTFEEMEYLAEYLSKIDLDSLSLELINTVVMTHGMAKKKLEIPKKPIEEKVEETHEENRLLRKEEKVIPNI